MNGKNTQQQEQRKLMMLNEPISRVIPKMAIPIAVYMLRKIKRTNQLYQQTLMETV